MLPEAQRAAKLVHRHARLIAATLETPEVAAAAAASAASGVTCDVLRSLTLGTGGGAQRAAAGAASAAW